MSLKYFSKDYTDNEVVFQVYTGIIPRTVNTKALHYYNSIKSKYYIQLIK